MGIVFYASSIFKLAGSPITFGTTATALIQTPVTVLGVLVLDRLGRRPVLLASLIGASLGSFLVGSAFVLQEWVTDSPFIISPITFEVSVRLLGGLMALGYTIATILKRSSHIFSDDRVCENRLVRADKPKEEEVLKRCWLARYWCLAAPHEKLTQRLQDFFLTNDAHASSVLVLGIFIVAYELDSPEMIQDAEIRPDDKN
ncbi:hypothetical protein POM88_016404 [Heracleum sosnowskyi]|uniref:Uncharacterized protein n=1 Tax=Heracleum sosnowskyi TaxID=360622 RepID=A0AAD8INS9_9APIA|nr:hypothetical protein POM88_016404 [Heracleum sosnowskyi]